MTMNTQNGNEFGERELHALLKQALPPVSDERHRDLWPGMLARMGDGAQRVPWFDWVLAAGVVGWLAFFPGVIPVLLYHL
jgi:hypothetical protein